MVWRNSAGGGTQWLRVTVLGLALSMVVACSSGAEGAAAGADEPGSDEPAVENERSTEVDVTIMSDDEEVLVVTSDRPDWLPGWLLLPEGLNISAAMNTPGTGDAAITGSVPDSNADDLYNDALFMAQSGGYVVTEEFVAGARGFAAEHTSDGSELVFTVVQVVDDNHQWSWEFGGLGGADAEAGSNVATNDSGPYTRRGNLTFTVTEPRTFVRFDGACEAASGEVLFESDDGSTDFMITSEDPPANGAITIDGEVQPWVVAGGSETSTAETYPSGGYYEGDFVKGADRAFGIIQITCNE